MKVKLAQRELRKDMYGDDFKGRLAALQGDNDAIEQLEEAEAPIEEVAPIGKSIF